MLRFLIAVALLHGCPANGFAQTQTSAVDSRPVEGERSRGFVAPKRKSEASEHYRQGVERVAENRTLEAIAAFREAIWLDRNYVPAYNQLGRLFSRMGDNFAAIQFFRQGLKIDASVDAYVGIARALEAEGHLNDAASYYWGATKMSPDDAELRYTLGQILSRLNAVEQAVEQFERAVRVEPERAEFHRDLGSELSKLNDSRKAMRHLREAVRIDPGISNADFYIGRELVVIGEHRDAVPHLRRAIRLQDDSASAHHLLGVAYESLDLPGEALQSYRAAMRIKPDWVLPMIAAAWLLATNPDATIREPDFAVTLAERAVRTTPKQDARFLDVLAAAYAAKGEFARAVSAAEAALKVAHDDNGLRCSAEIAERLKLYRNNKPFVEPWSPGF